jgi:hypothetical protein
VSRSKAAVPYNEAGGTAGCLEAKGRICFEFPPGFHGNGRLRSDFVLDLKWRITVFITAPYTHQFLF